MEIWDRIEQARTRWNVLEHSFYERWSEGTLTREELASYSGQYRHAVEALARASADAAGAAEGLEAEQLAEHADEEAAHVALWDGFVAGVGGSTDSPATPETARCARTWAGEDRPLPETLVALYAIESGQPAISETKRAGLIDHYGFSEGEATRYFTLHARRDVEHAAHARELIEARLAEADADALVDEAERVLRANWELLDGVERVNGRAA